MYKKICLACLLILPHISLMASEISPIQKSDKFGSIAVGITQVALKTTSRSDFNSKREALYVHFKKGSSSDVRSPWLKVFSLDGSVENDDRNGLYSLGVQGGLGYRSGSAIYFATLGVEGINLLIPNPAMDSYNAIGGTLGTSAFFEVQAGFGVEIGYKLGWYKSKVKRSLNFIGGRWSVSVAYYDFNL